MATFPLQRFTVSGNSMVPTLKEGQDVLVWCWFNKIKVGDIVVIKINGKEMVKRIQSVHDPASRLLRRSSLGYEGRAKLRWASRKYFVIGDNPKESTDSRKFGPITQEDIVGKVVFVR